MRPGFREPTRMSAPPSSALRDYMEAPIRRPWLVAVPLVLGVLAAVAAILILPKQYASATLILVEAEKAPAIVAGSAAVSPGRRLETLKQEVLSRTRLERVIQELDPYPERRGEPLTVTVETMRNAVDIDVKDNDAFSIEYTHRNPVKARDVTDRMAALFIEETNVSRETQVQQATAFLEVQVQQAAKELEAHEQAVQRYRQTHLGTLPEQVQSNLATLQRLQLEQDSLGQSVRAAQDRVAMLEGQPVAGRPAMPAPPTQVALRAELEALRGRYTDEHPDVVALRARLERLDRVERVAPAPSRMNSALASAQAEVVSLRARREELDRRMGDFQRRVEAAPRAEQELTTLSRDLAKLKENYLALLNKKLDAQMTEKLEKRWRGERFKVLDPASLPDRAVSPRRLVLLVAGSLVGAVVGLVLALGAEVLDQSVKNVADLQSTLPYPLLGSIAHIELPGERRWGGLARGLGRAS